MATNQAPGVYVNQVPPSGGPITGVGTTTPAFIGAPSNTTATTPAVGVVKAYTNFTKFKNDFVDSTTYGSDYGQWCLTNAVYGFFKNGGVRCYVTRVNGPTASPNGDVTGPTGPTGATGPLAETVEQQADHVIDSLKAARETVAAAQETVTTAKATGYTVVVQDKEGNTVKVKGGARLAVLDPDKNTVKTVDPSELMDTLSNQAEKVQEAAQSVENAAANIKALVQRALDHKPPPPEQPTIVSSRTPPDGWSTINVQPALDALARYDDIFSVVAPGLSDLTQWSAILGDCQGTTTSPLYRFAVLDAPANTDWTSSPPLTSALPGDPTNTYGAIYFPWIVVADPIDNTLTPVPPSGHIAGVYATNDAQYGVYKAPANQGVIGALDLQYLMSNVEQGGLNAIGINCIRRLNGGILVWGARTVNPKTGTDFLYVSSRRLYNYICASLVQSTQWAVFEPNNAALWGQIIRTVTTFLTGIWQAGGLFGATANEAFYVKCDEETNPPESRAQGNVVTEVGIAITQPAEFVVFNLTQLAT